MEPGLRTQVPRQAVLGARTQRGWRAPAGWPGESVVGTWLSTRGRMCTCVRGHMRRLWESHRWGRAEKVPGQEPLAREKRLRTLRTPGPREADSGPLCNLGIKSRRKRSVDTKRPTPALTPLVLATAHWQESLWEPGIQPRGPSTRGKRSGDTCGGPQPATKGEVTPRSTVSPEVDAAQEVHRLNWGRSRVPWGLWGGGRTALVDLLSTVCTVAGYQMNTRQSCFCPLPTDELKPRKSVSPQQHQETRIRKNELNQEGG